MIRHTLRCSMLAALLVAVPAHAACAPKAAGPANAAGKTAIKTDPAHDAMMAEMAKYGIPGADHGRLKPMAGRWKAVTKSWFAPGEPTMSEGVSDNRLILDGRYLEQRFSGKMGEEPFEGYGLTGYDNRKQQYTMLWIDNMSTEMMTGSGGMDAAGKELTMTSMGAGPDGAPMPLRMVTRIVDDKTHTFSMYGKGPDGKDQLMMEITYTQM